MMCVRSTPPVAARMQASTLGRIPPATAPLARRLARSSGSANATRLEGSSRSRSTPGAPVRKMSFCARSATASDSATVSALTLNTLPSPSPARLATTGTNLRLEQREQHPRVHAVEVADVAVVHRLGLPGVVHHLDGGAAMGGDQVGVHPAQPHRLRLVGAERGQQVHVQLPGVDHLRDGQGVVVGDASPGDDPRLVAHPAAERRGLRAAAVHHHEADAEAGQERHLGGDVVHRPRVRQHLAAELDHEDLVTIGADIAQGALQPGNSL